MREPTFYVLAALLRGPLHGYAIMKRAEELSGGRVRLATGTLYTALDRLTAEGHVQLVGEESVGGRVRRTYGLTESGSAALRAEATPAPGRRARRKAIRRTRRGTAGAPCARTRRYSRRAGPGGAGSWPPVPPLP
jgi:DNA-binding PadR family transcriptional regulator